MKEFKHFKLLNIGKVLKSFSENKTIIFFRDVNDKLTKDLELQKRLFQIKEDDLIPREFELFLVECTDVAFYIEFDTFYDKQMNLDTALEYFKKRFIDKNYLYYKERIYIALYHLGKLWRENC